MEHATGIRYYVDNGTGSDENDGKSEDRAWRSIEKVNTVGLQDGDAVFFRGGQLFSGTLAVTGSNGSPAGVLIVSFGDGRATIYGGSAYGVVLEGLSHVTVARITVAGCGRKAGSDGSGVRITDSTEETFERFVEVLGKRQTFVRGRIGSPTECRR